MSGEGGAPGSSGAPFAAVSRLAPPRALTDPPPLEARAVGQRAGPLWFLRDCSLELERGCTALVGPNGAGKTTLLRVLAGIRPPAAGRIYLHGRPVGEDELRQAVAYVPQFPGVHGRLRAAAHLERIAAWWGLPAPRAEAAEALERLGLAAAADRRGGELGAAERRRLALAEAWIRRCRIVLFDEPTADLDPEERAAFWAELSALQDDPTGPDAACVTTHRFDEVGAHCAGAVVLAQGRVCFAGSVRELAARAAGRCFRIPPAGHGDAAETAAASDGAGAAQGPGRRPGIIIGVDPDGARLTFGYEADHLPAEAVPRAPTPLDGYLHALVEPARGRGGLGRRAARTRRGEGGGA